MEQGRVAALSTKRCSMPALTILTPPFPAPCPAVPRPFRWTTVPCHLTCRSLSSRPVFPYHLSRDLLTPDLLGPFCFTRPPLPGPLASPLPRFLFNFLGLALATPHVHLSGFLTLPSFLLALATFLTLALPRLITLSPCLPSPPLGPSTRGWMYSCSGVHTRPTRPRSRLRSFSARHTVTGGFFPDDVVRNA
ncbi:hypothetical protein EI94DRAFT_1730178 [Lactarius quietus]|nr:hypothetical protein EI94DRAFT_1730178 [Lactarius quietus]